MDGEGGSKVHTSPFVKLPFWPSISACSDPRRAITFDRAISQCHKGLSQVYPRRLGPKTGLLNSALGRWEVVDRGFLLNILTSRVWGYVLRGFGYSKNRAKSATAESLLGLTTAQIAPRCLPPPPSRTTTITTSPSMAARQIWWANLIVMCG